MNQEEQIREFLSDIAIISLSEKFDKIQKDTSEVGFNVFTLTSDLYYRENFHSDIIAAFLNPKAKHNEGNLFLDAFIDMLNRKMKRSNKNSTPIRKDFYVNALVERERHKIDILITTIDKRHCIIIENKINNAPDMRNQIPRYYDVVREDGYEVDAIVYLPLNINKSVDRKSWYFTKPDDENKINEVLVRIPAYDSLSNEINLVAHWIEPLMSVTKNIDCVSLLRQYSELLKSLAPDMVKSSTMKELYEYIVKDAKLINQAKLFISMMKNLPGTLAENLRRELAELPSKPKVFQWKNQFNNCVVEFNINDVNSQIYIYTYLDSDIAYEVFIREQYDWITEELRQTFKQQGDGSIKRCFAFGQEQEVIDAVRTIIEQHY